jgi:hypothetical protein
VFAWPADIALNFSDAFGHKISMGSRLLLHQGGHKNPLSRYLYKGQMLEKKFFTQFINFPLIVRNSYIFSMVRARNRF